MLKISDHSRDSAGLTYVYPVVSRRAEGISVGINLNVNNACNWHCVYCQVPDLKRGGPPPVDLKRLADELSAFLEDVIYGSFLASHAPPEIRRLMDIAFSGNGEPTSASEFAEAVQVVEGVMSEFKLLEKIKLRLITNGSLLQRESVRRGISRIGALNGEVWFKLDRATEDGINLVNGVRISPTRLKASLMQCAELAPTWVQTCFFAFDGLEPDEMEKSAYLRLIEFAQPKIRGVHLYSLARPSLQVDAQRISRTSQEKLRSFADRISGLGVKVINNP
jgi:wyosine [tRNA(Phe)-imidazoG37] synthetase (radical SAM superfamily)